MTLRVEQTPAAEADLIDHYRSIARHDPDAAERCFAEVEAFYPVLADNPHMGAERDYGRTGPLRMFPVPGFRNWLVFYRATEDVVEVVRVIHAKQDLPTLFGE